MMNKFFTKLALISCISGFTVACAPSVEVSAKFPTPLIAPLPHTAGIYFPEGFNSFTYTETSSDRDKWTISIGNAQSTLYQTIATGLFRELSVVEQAPPWEQPLPMDLIIVPNIRGFEYTVPQETKNKVYEVQLRYALEIYTGNGTLIADWILNTYGKTPSGFIQSDEDSMEAAVIMALRDGGARLALQFAKIPEVASWLQQQHTTQANNGE